MNTFTKFSTKKIYVLSVEILYNLTFLTEYALKMLVIYIKRAQHSYLLSQSYKRVTKQIYA